jgi:hypothetical protein
MIGFAKHALQDKLLERDAPRLPHLKREGQFIEFNSRHGLASAYK